MAEWTNIWVIGQAQAMTAFLNAKKIDDGQGNQVLPHEIFVVGPIYPNEQDGVDANGNPKYKRKSGQQLALWCFSLHGDKATLIDELKLLNNPNYVILDTVTEQVQSPGGGMVEITRPYTLAEVQALYPAYALGQGIPHIAGS